MAAEVCPRILIAFSSLTRNTNVALQKRDNHGYLPMDHLVVNLLRGSMLDDYFKNTTERGKSLRNKDDSNATQQQIAGAVAKLFKLLLKANPNSLKSERSNSGGLADSA